MTASHSTHPQPPLGDEEIRAREGAAHPARKGQRPEREPRRAPPTQGSLDTACFFSQLHLLFGLMICSDIFWTGSRMLKYARQGRRFPAFSDLRPSDLGSASSGYFWAPSGQPLVGLTHS